MRFGILGWGKITRQALAPAIAEAGHTVVAVGSREPGAAVVPEMPEVVWSGYQAVLDNPAVDAVYIALPNHLHAATAVRALDAIGRRWILVETVGVGQVEVEVAGKADTTVVVVNPGWGDSVQANKAGLMEIADIFVINKADRKGADETRRDLMQMLDLSDLATDTWRPPIINTTGTTGEGVVELWDTVIAHRAFAESSGLLAQRRTFRLREELREIIAQRLGRKARQICTGDRWDELTAEVVAQSIDPWSAADEMLAAVDA